ncbi:protein FAR1-RELATED SEQUENCE 7-like [Telopea speciosissima]|uniref:protein FAR1-RELATED SEQUENCE 7-like n=1 Tax=Telopea speciosissima TaxID=54955 RepID=UPI001CC71C63|nr:protein FAR1-RELATED SEQUENCE 7-like [Telopea speciosissima]
MLQPHRRTTTHLSLEFFIPFSKANTATFDVTAATSDEPSIEGNLRWVMDNPIDTSDKPFIGMQFDSDNDAFEFYNSYGRRVGFSVRREYANKSKKDNTKITSMRLVCSKQGLRKKDKRVDDAISSGDEN